ncbi:MAG: hypothetical protein RR055_04295 [Oscillospiraceae bacterium]
MSKLHKKMVALGDMSQYSYDDIVAACGEPREKRHCAFTDIGEGSRATWSDGIFTITFNFNSDGMYCGISFHRNIEPYLWLGTLSALIILAALVVGIHTRKTTPVLDAASTQTLLAENESLWLTEDTAGACLLDLDFDGRPELLSTETEIIHYDADNMDFFGDSAVSVWSLEPEGMTKLGGFVTDEYCYLAALHLYSDGSGHRGWYYSSNGEIYLLSLINGALTDGIPEELPNMSGGDEAFPLLRNESWISVASPEPNPDVARADIAAVVAEYFS